MSAGGSHSAESLVQRGFDGLAPKFREALEAALEECNDQGLDAYAYETLRSDELQELYYARGRTDIDGEFPLGHTVTNRSCRDDRPDVRRRGPPGGWAGPRARGGDPQ